MKLDLMSATARPSEQPFTRPVMKTSGVGQAHNRCSPEPPAMRTKNHNVNELVLDLTSRVSHMNISANSNASSSNDSPSTNSNAPLMSSESSPTAPSMSSESSSTNSNARVTSDATQPADINSTTHSTEDDGCVSYIASPLTNANGSVSTSDTSPTNEKAEGDTKINGVANNDIEDIEEKLSNLNFNIKPDAEECQSTKEIVDEVEKEQVEDDEVDVAARDLVEVEGDTSNANIKEGKDKDDVLKRAIKGAVTDEEERRGVIKEAVTEEEERRGVIKEAVTDEEEPPKTEVKVSSGGNLCPRSPMRPEFSQQRNEPYNQASRNAHHSGGRIVQVSTPDITEPISSISLHQNNWLGTCNISPFHTPGDVFVTQPVYPFISCTSSPQGQAYVDEGICDLDANADGLYLDDVANAACEGTKEEALSALADLAADDDFWEILKESNSKLDDLCASPNGIPAASDIPESVRAYEANSPPQTSWRTEPMIPSVGSSGYHSSSSPRSTSTPSPTSLQESHDRYPSSPVDVDTEWHGTTSEVYNGDDVVFDSDLLDGLDLGADVHPQPSLHAEVFQTMPCFDGAWHDASSFVHVPTAVPQFRQNITQVLPNITQLMPDVTQLMPDVGQQPCQGVGGGVRGPSGNRVLKQIQPKPSTTAKSATLRMAERLNKERKGKIWAKISTITDEDVVRGDEDGDTQLMILLVQEPTKEQGKNCKLEFVYALVERLKRIPGALTSVNSQQESALYLAALHCSDKDSALITRYIAEAMFEAHANVDMVYKGGDSLMHCLCRDGANRYEVLKELLSLKDANHRLYFDINKYNDKGLTPLLEAVNSHGHSDSTKSIRLLLDAGADTTLTVRDTPTTALHLAIATSCDPNLVDALLTDACLAAVCSNYHYREAGVLHLAAARNDVAAERQRHVMDALVARGARRDERDREGRLPCERLSAERKEAFKS